MSRLRIAIVLAVLAGAPVTQILADGNGAVGINVVLDRPVSDGLLADLGRYGQVLDVIAEIKAVTLKAHASDLEAIQALPYVVAADTDEECVLADDGGLPVPDLSAGDSDWSLDAINVTDHGAGRTVAYDGEGVYVAVLDTGLPHNWRSYFPEERIAVDLARAFCGGGGEAATISSQPEKWESDTGGHETQITSVILGFAYAGEDGELPAYFNGVAPRATIIPVMVGGSGAGQNRSYHSGHWESLMAHSIVYVTNLKVQGVLGASPLVINLSSGLARPVPLERAAIDYAIANGVVVVAAAGNSADAGMGYPAAYPELISVGATGWVDQLLDDPSTYRWSIRDVPEGDVSQHFVAPFSSRELPGQQLDLTAPGAFVPGAKTVNGTEDYTFSVGTSFGCPNVAGVVALMLQRNPTLTQAQIEAILKSTALPLPPRCVDVLWPGIGPGNEPTWDDHGNIFSFDVTTCWDTDATGAGLLQADAALAATPLP